MCAHYIFYNFSQRIFYYMPKNFIFALQIDFIFPMCVCVLSKIKISHSNIIPIYYYGAAQDRRGGLNRLRVYLAYGEYKTRLKSAQAAWHSHDAICAHNLHGLYHIDKFPTDSYTLFYYGKMCECTQISYEKMWWCKRIFIWKMWMMLTLILI